MLKFEKSMLSVEAIGSYTWGWVNERKNPSCLDYLRFAQNDLSDGKSPRNLVNALGNAKRALHLRMEDLCNAFGFPATNRENKFPSLLEYARDCGFASPRILRKINTLRNSVEHEYVVPDAGEVDNFVDVVELFIAATDRWLTRQPSDFDYFLEHQTGGLTFYIVHFYFHWTSATVTIQYTQERSSSPRDRKVINIGPASPDFFECVRFAIENDD